MKVTAPKLIRWAGLSAVVAGLMFVVIQPLHPPDELASVTTDAWATIHYLTFVMLVFFIFGITGIYARQVEAAGWLGLVGYLVLSVGLLTQMPFGFVEAFIQPGLASRDPETVEALLGLINGSTNAVDLGALPTLYSISGLLFLGGTLVFGAAIFRARILSRWAAALFAVGGPALGLVAGLFSDELQRLTAVPIGLGLAWLGLSLWSEGRMSAAEPIPGRVGT